MTRRNYFRICLSIATWDRAWAARVLKEGPEKSPHMKPIHFRLLALAMRQTA